MRMEPKPYEMGKIHMFANWVAWRVLIIGSIVALFHYNSTVRGLTFSIWHGLKAISPLDALVIIGMMILSALWQINENLCRLIEKTPEKPTFEHTPGEEVPLTLSEIESELEQKERADQLHQIETYKYLPKSRR